MIIDWRFNGPPGSANGGYTAGLFARELVALETLAAEALASRKVPDAAGATRPDSAKDKPITATANPTATPENPTATGNPTGTPQNPSGTTGNPTGTTGNPTGTTGNPTATPGNPAGASGSAGGAVVVTLRRPPPLDTLLTVRPTDAGARLINPDDEVVADASRTEIGDEALVEPVGWDAAVAASQHYGGFTAHPFPTCFVCGPERGPGDGLRLFPGRVGPARTATPWVVPAGVDQPLVWAALDCPGGWAVPLEARPYVLGRMAAAVAELPEPGSRCVIMGEVLAEEGRKAQVRTTLYDSAGVPLARAFATWIALSSV